MVILNKIYTKTGDQGQTSLGNGSRVEKHSLRIEAYGTVDESNATIGLARMHTQGSEDDMLSRIQNDLFDLGADVSMPTGSKFEDSALRVHSCTSSTP